MRALTVRAGPIAAAWIRERGLSLDDVEVLVGASGGPKWLVLAGVDRVLFPRLVGRRSPLQLLGSSIGSWRLACLAQADPVAALDRFGPAYIEQHYEARPSIHEVSRVLEEVLSALLGPTGVKEILSSPWARLHVLTNRGKGLAALDATVPLALGLGLTAVGNLFSRSAMGWLLERVLFRHPQGTLEGLTDAVKRTVEVPLTEQNCFAALAASGSIPMVLAGVRIDGDVHRDGGIIDYHPAFEFRSAKGLVLYPHFYPHVIPGWFDKSRRARWASAAVLARTVVLSPSEAFVRTLPGARIPDRKDFYAFPEAERIGRWYAVAKASAAVGEELGELLEAGTLAERVEPVPA